MTAEKVYRYFDLIMALFVAVLVISNVASSAKIVDLGFGLVILAGIMMYYGHPPESTAVWVPLLFFIHLLFTLGLSYPLAALNLFFHDVRFLVGVALTLWFYLTPVIYPLSRVPPKYAFIYDVNPNALFIDAYRRVILHGQVPALEKTLVGLGVSVVTFLVGYYLFKKMEPHFADRI